MFKLNILDRYIILKFLKTFFFTVLLFNIISVVIDFSEKIEKFIEEPITPFQIAFGYYPNFVLDIDGILFPLFTLIAVVFFTSRLATNSEIISILNAGVSFGRLLYPYLIGATIIAGMLLMGSHYIVPNGNKIRLDLVYKYIHKNDDKGKTQDVHFFVAPNAKVFVHKFYKGQNRVNKFRYERFQDAKLVYMLKANSAKYIEADDKWELNDYEVRKFTNTGQELYIGRGQKKDTTLNLKPSDFVDYKDQHTMMTTPELLDYIDYLNSRGASNTKKYVLEFYRRSAEPFSIYILTIIGVAIAARKVRGGLGLHLAFGIGLCAMYVFLSRFSVVFALGSALPPLVGIWIPNFIFGSIAIYLVRIAQK